ncbi:MAG: thiamine diphosphokinase [Acidimicrobiia bacterium]|nr:thiamine diphosphokinase [Acidimicrobiia bacterium]
MSDVVLLLAGGTEPGPELLAALPTDGVSCIAADSGLDHARALGLRPELVVGDLDSVSPAALAWAEAQGIPIERHPVDKAQTDLELALARAVAQAPDRVLVAGIGGGRLDHFLANIGVLASPRWAAVALDGWIDGARIAVVHPGRPRVLAGAPGDLLSLLPINGDAVGVTVTGVAWPLDDDTLAASSSRGVSNVFTQVSVVVQVSVGTLLAVRPAPSASATGV